MGRSPGTAMKASRRAQKSPPLSSSAASSESIPSNRAATVSTERTEDRDPARDPFADQPLRDVHADLQGHRLDFGARRALDDQAFADLRNQIADGLRVGMVEQAIEHLFTLELGRLAVAAGDVGDHLRLQLPQGPQFGKKGQPAERARRQRQAAGGQRRLPGRFAGQRAGTSLRLLPPLLHARRGLADIIENGFGDPLSGPEAEAVSGEGFVSHGDLRRVVEENDGFAVLPAGADGRSFRGPAPDAGEPGLLRARQAGGPIVVFEFNEAGVDHAASPGGEVVVGGVAFAVPSLLVLAAWIRAEQHTVGLEGGAQLPQNARQGETGHMKQRGIGEDPVKTSGRKIELEKVLMPDLTAGIGTRHFHEASRTIQSDDAMTETGKGLQVTAGAATEVEDRKRRVAMNMSQQGGDILTDIVAARACAELFGTLVIVGQRVGGNLFEFVGMEPHR